MLLSNLAKITNVLIIVWGDSGWRDIAPYVPTPNLVAASQQGVGFGSWITQPVGSHTFYSVLFGRYAIRNGNTRGFSWFGDLPESPDIVLGTPSLARAAGDAGYRVALFGKWAIGGNDLGIDEEFNTVTPYLHGVETWGAGIGEGLTGGAGKGFREWERIDDGILTLDKTYADRQIKREWTNWWLNTAAPRFSIIWFVAGHGPHDELPPAYLMPAGYVPDDTTERGRYEAMMVGLDALTGEVLQLVDLTDTLVVIFSACGPPDKTGIVPVASRAKRSTYDTGIRTPAVVLGPGIRPGFTDELASPVDLWATIAELTDVPPPPRGTDSVSFAQLLEGSRNMSSRRYVYSQHVEEAIRTKTHKLRRADGVDELFELAKDPWELNPLDPDTYFDQELVQNLRFWMNNPGSGMVEDHRRY